ncbi:hypothetical protein [Halorubrum tibetense]|uniref:DUF8009 domain-containing protein n=1 Tax=Halorubrum tibetense TaxID=175631 RepID=A0ABD5SDH0_9EURY
MADDTQRESDPARIRSVAVHREDVANALEASLRSDRVVVLRVTPPFSGRMRARLHSVDADPETGSTDGATRPAGPTGPIHLDPRALVEEYPPYPEVDETTAEGPGDDVEARRERHGERVEAWRETVRDAVGGTVSVPVADGTHEVAVVALG